jgi:catechol 2,3-dioxygenase-like lactoylglutathione lyase family enzyme
MKILFCAGFGPLVRDKEASLHFYRDVLGLPLPEGDYVATDDIEGIKHFGLWTVADAATSIFGTDRWPDDVPVPQGGIEFEVEDVDEAAAELQARGCALLVGPMTEPWGQKVARLLSPEGLLVGVTYTPWMRT